MGSFGDRGIDQRLIGDEPRRFDPAGGEKQQLRRAIVDAGRKLARRKAAEDDRMHRADAGAGEHRDDGLRHHRHVDDDTVAGLDPLRAEDGGKSRDLGSQLRIGQRALRCGNGRIMDEGGLRAAACRDMAVEAIMSGVAEPVGEPAAIDAGIRVKGDPRRSDPVDRF